MKFYFVYMFVCGINYRLFLLELYIINLQAPQFLYIGQEFRYSPENAFYIFNQQIYFII